MKSATYRRDWKSVGKAAGYCGTPDADSRIARAIDAMNWEALTPGFEFPMMPGMGINAAIQEFRMPKVSHVANSNRLAPYGFYGIRAHYSNGTVQLYLVDSGTELCPVCADFYPVAAS